MRPLEQREQVFELARLGLNECAIARETGIPRSTLRQWLQPRYVKRGRPREHYISAATSCTACGHPDHRLPPPFGWRYAHLFGLYLGDGAISRSPKGVYALRIVMDARYPELIYECRFSMGVVMPTSAVSTTRKPGCVEIKSWSKAWPCLFPQHGPGRKHERRIELQPWQREVVEREPQWFLRGLIQSDGCRVLNRVNGGVYPRYFFTQVSTDIQKLFCDACDLLGIEWRQNRWNSISVAKRKSVALLDEFVGPKDRPAEP